MKTIKSPVAAQKYFMRLVGRGKTIGFVPTMGALHAGHVSLIKKARRENDVAVVSIFVNPTQFGPKDDFKKYPRAFARDVKMCRAAGVEVVFAPSADDMYPAGFATKIAVPGGLSEGLCGASRPGHFAGVAAVVAKLFNIIRPTRAYFGEKDYQQLKIIERLAADMAFPVKIISCPTVRERDGLAMSSRNANLSSDERKNAASVYRILSEAKKSVARNPARVPPRFLEKKIASRLGRIPEFRVEYVSVSDARTLVALARIPRDSRRYRILAAVKIGSTRLIDNV